MPHFFLLPGLNGDTRIFDRLAPLLPSATIVPWVPPRSRESISEYAARLALTIDPREDLIVCGVSFGGIVAQELASQSRARACVLISSVRNGRQLPPWYRPARMLGPLIPEQALAAIGSSAASLPRRMRSQSTAQTTQLAGESGEWRCWAISSLLRWRPPRSGGAVLQIHGDKDITFPIRYVDPDVVIEGGGHLIALTHAEEIASIVETCLNGRI
jgi:pimeloyl-ACP methyl ester carboxylesterase